MRDMARAWITDVTTTPDAPPRFRALEREGRNVHRDMSYPAALASLQEARFPGLRPLRTDLEPQQLFELVQAAALEMSDWAIAAIEPHRLSLEAVATSRWLRLRYDVVIQVRALPDGAGGGAGGSAVHMRSKARRSGPDLGGNARRIRVFLERVERKIGQGA